MLKLLRTYHLLFILMLFLFVPGGLFLLSLVVSKEKLPEALQPDYHLVGATNKNKLIAFSFANIKQHQTQKYIESFITERLPFRSLLIRLNNQLYYNLFHISYSESGSLIIGKSKQLFTKHYIDNYCHDAIKFNVESLEVWVKKLKEISDFYKNEHKTFVYLISPSKAEYMPENIPARFHCENKGLTNHIRLLHQLLLKYDVPFIDGASLMPQLAEMYHTPMFVRGGIHWNQLGSTAATNLLIQIINKDRNIYISPIKFKYSIKKEAVGRDTDLLTLLNLLKPNMNYRTPILEYETISSKVKPLKITLIGGSFFESIYDALVLTNAFSEISYLNYFKEWETTHINNKNEFFKPIHLPSLIAKINSSDVIVLEENSEFTISNHGNLFYEMLQDYSYKRKTFAKK